MSEGEHIKADDYDTCLVEFSLTEFNSENSAKGKRLHLRVNSLLGAFLKHSSFF